MRNQWSISKKEPVLVSETWIPGVFWPSNDFVHKQVEIGK
jgi:hypothetical protein